MNTAKKYLFFFLLFLIAVLFGCAIEIRGVGRTPAGSLQNPIIDSDISLTEALRKESPPEFKERLRLVDVLYYSFDGKIHKGQLVIDERLVEDIREVFRVALENKFPIASVIPISHDRFFKNGKWNEDDQSMLSNNTSAFNYRTVTGEKSLSKHAYGFAIDINPVQNPYIKGNIVLPPNAVYDTRKPGTLAYDSPVVKTFIRLGWAWGGNWKSLKDYQHFEKVLPHHISGASGNETPL
ncbi:MAG: M15 family metallopeptidase [Candidatus Omnitrophota bacterium]|nr:M15 family metallopeptidase [Candidatus Omnitrophota bacterium]